MLYLLGFHSLVLGRVAVFLVDAVKVDTTRVAFVIVAFTLEMVKIFTWFVEALSSEPFTGHLLYLTVNRRV